MILNIEIINFQFLDGDAPHSLPYGGFILRLIRCVVLLMSMISTIKTAVAESRIFIKHVLNCIVDTQS